MNRRLHLAWLAPIILLATPVAAQVEVERLPGYLPIEYLDVFGVDEISVEINLRGAMLKMISAFTGEEDPEFAELVAGLDAVHVRSGELAPDRFAEVGGRLMAAERWLADNGWDAIVRVTEENESVSVFLREQGGDIVGLAILALDDAEATVVNLVGRIDPAQIGRLAGAFDIELDDLPSIEDMQP